MEDTSVCVFQNGKQTRFFHYANESAPNRVYGKTNALPKYSQNWNVFKVKFEKCIEYVHKAICWKRKTKEDKKTMPTA